MLLYIGDVNDAACDIDCLGTMHDYVLDPTTTIDGF